MRALTRTADPPEDSLDLRTIRDGGRREIPWDALAGLELLPAQRDALVRSWRARMKQERVAVAAFALLTSELVAVGCDSVVLALVTRAAADEVRHADVCKRLADGIAGRPSARYRPVGGFAAPGWEGASARDTALLHVVAMCCLNETFTGVYLTEMLERATHPAARAAIESLLEDEIDHGRVGWAHLASAVGEGWGAAVVRPRLAKLVEDSVGPVFAAATRAPEADDPAKEALGYLGLDTAAEIHRRALAEVIFPGFESVGIETTAARALARSRRWTPDDGGPAEGN